MIYKTTLPSPVGTLTLPSDGAALTGLWIENQKYFFPNGEGAASRPELEIFECARLWLDAYFDGKRPDISALPLSPQGSEFAKLIWSFLCDIPYGETTTYGALAAKAAEAMGRAHMSAQAVGGAVGHNPISIIIPCHRVLGANGCLTGYAGGLERKRFLLNHECQT